MTNRYGTLWAKVRRLYGHFKRIGNGWALVEATALLRQTLGRAMSIRVDRGRYPSERTLRRVIHAYEALPEAMRERLDSGQDALPFIPADRLASLAGKAEAPARPRRVWNRGGGEVWMGIDLRNDRPAGYLVMKNSVPLAWVKGFNEGSLATAWKIANDWAQAGHGLPDVVDLRLCRVRTGGRTFPSLIWRSALVRVDRGGRIVMDAEGKPESGLYGVNLDAPGRMGFIRYQHHTPAVIEEALRPFQEKTRSSALKPMTLKLAGVESKGGCVAAA